MTKNTLIGTISLFLLTSALTASAEQRALLVGVGEYADPVNNLPAIDLDLDRMWDTLIVMGFKESQIHTLLDEQATSSRVKSEIGGWLTKGVQPTDRVIFYFSGHGANIPDIDGDEPDGVDEVLVTHDVQRARVKGKKTLIGVVRDDELFGLFTAIPSQKVLTIIDACHSGTSTRSFNLETRSLVSDEVFPKSFLYEGMPDVNSSLFDRSASDSDEVNFVSISAAGDTEKAIGTSKGGMFTIGLSTAITEAARAGNNITIQELRDKAASYIEAHLDKNRVHHPQVTGNIALASGALSIVPLAAGNGPNRRKLVSMIQGQGKEFGLQSSQTTYVVDDLVKLQMVIPTNGYLNLVTVDAADNATVLFPNQYHLNNAVEAGAFTIPTEKMTFDLPASEPLGPTLVAAFVTQDPINFYDQTLDERDVNGNINVDFASLSHTATRALRVAPKKKEMYAAQLELMIVAKP